MAVCNCVYGTVSGTVRGARSDLSIDQKAFWSMLRSLRAPRTVPEITPLSRFLLPSKESVPQYRL